MLDSAESIRLLIVDDERLIADTLATIFRNEGYDARAAYSAEEALALIDSWIPELAILDVYLPGMNGIDLAIRLKAEVPSCRITLFSGQSSSNDLLDQARRDGHALDIIPKPVHPSELLSLLASYRVN
jgi:DNA-binding response OmpR family regulator